MSAGFNPTARNQLSFVSSISSSGEAASIPRPSSSASLVNVAPPQQKRGADSRHTHGVLARRLRAMRSFPERLADGDYGTYRAQALISEAGDSDSESTAGSSDGDADAAEDAHGTPAERDRRSQASRSSSSDDESRKVSKLACAPRFKKRLSILDWAPRATASSLQADLLAGLTVCVMVIPQSMSYANIAGLPYVIGLYSACVPTLVYAFFGQSRQLAVGPVAMVSLILRAGLTGKLDEKQCPEWYNDDVSRPEGVYQNMVCTEEYCALAFSVAAMIGVIKIFACVFKLSFLVSFLGHPVISGFSTGSAIIIGCSQLKYFLGYALPSTEHVHELVYGLVKDIDKLQPAPLILGFTWLAFLMTTKRLARKHRRFKMLGPLGPLLGCIAGTLLVWGCPALREKYHVRYVGEVPGGMFPVSAGKLTFTWEQFDKIKVTAISAALIGYMESIAIAKNLAGQHGYSIDAGQELLALGISNVVGSMFSCYPVTGSFSRSAVANTTGAQTQLAGVVTAVGMLVVLLCLTPLFYYLPMFALAAIVLNSVMQLVAYDVAIELWKVKKWDFVLWVVSFIGTLFIGPLEGIGLSVLMSLGLIIHESVRPHITILWRLPGTNVYRSIDQEQHGQFVPGVMIVRVGASLYFANALYVKEALLKFIEDLAQVDDHTEYLVLEMASVLSIDSTAAHVIHDVIQELKRRGIVTSFAMVTKRAMRTMQRASVASFAGERWFFPSVDDAVRSCLSHRYTREHRDGEEVEESENFLVISSDPEVGVSNDLHHTYTTVMVRVPCPVAGIVHLISSIFVARGCRIVNAQVENIQHTYHLVNQERKLTSKEIEPLRAQLEKKLMEIYEKPGPVRERRERLRTNASLASGPLTFSDASPTVARVLTGQLGEEDGDADAELERQRCGLMEALVAERVKVAEGDLARKQVEELEAKLAAL